MQLPPKHERTPLDTSFVASLSAGAPPGTYESTYHARALTCTLEKRMTSR